MLSKLSSKQLSLLTILLYGCIYLSPFLVVASPKNVAITATTFFYALGAFLMIFLYEKNKNTAKTAIENTTKPATSFFMIILGIAGIFIALILQALVMSIEITITGENLSSKNTEAIITIILSNPQFLIATTLCGPIMEEFVFRRSFIGLMENYFGFWFSAVVSSSLFSFFHQDGHFFVYFSMGLFFVLLYKLTGRIWTSIIAHCGMNTLVVVTQLLLYYSNK